MRIVSLLPSGSEVVAALGLAQRMVARSHACDYPKEIVHLPPCTIPAHGSSGVDLPSSAPARCKEQQAVSVFQVDWGLLQALKPTHIITQTICRQCAVTADEVRDSLREEMHSSVELISFEALTLDGVVEEMIHAAACLGVPERGEALAERMRAKLQASRQRESQKAPADKPLVACLDWLEPLMMAGNWMPEMVRLAGGRPAGGGDGVHSGWMQWDELVAADPDMIVAMPCGFTLEQSRNAVRKLPKRAQWQQLRAVKEGKVYVTDGNQFFNRPGPRLLDSLEILEQILGTHEGDVRHQGIHWLQLPPAA